MEVVNLSKRIGKDDIKTLIGYAKRLDADEMIIHKDGSISLYCKDGGICEHYRPSRKELYK